MMARFILRSSAPLAMALARSTGSAFRGKLPLFVANGIRQQGAIEAMVLDWLWSLIGVGGNPTQSWEERQEVLLLLDLDEHRLSGVSVGEPLQGLNFLGRGNDLGSLIDWPAKGLRVHVIDGALFEITISFGHAEDDEDEIRKFPGRIVYRGETQRLTCRTHRDELLRLLGEPFWIDEEIDEEFGDETILFYEFGAIEWQIELGSDACLRNITFSPPLLADPEQRTAYKVTKPWPPK